MYCEEQYLLVTESSSIDATLTAPLTSSQCLLILLCLGAEGPPPAVSEAAAEAEKSNSISEVQKAIQVCVCVLVEIRSSAPPLCSSCAGAMLFSHTLLQCKFVCC